MRSRLRSFAAVTVAAALAGSVALGLGADGASMANAAAAAPSAPPSPVAEDLTEPSRRSFVAAVPALDHVLVKRAGAEVESVPVPRGTTPEAVLAELRAEEDELEYAEPDLIRTASVLPNDPQVTAANGQWGLHNTGQLGGTADADVDAPEAWDILGFTGSPWPVASYTIGVIDTGIQTGHPDISGRMSNYCKRVNTFGNLTTGCSDDNGHGTYTASIIAAKANNGIGMAGLAPNAKLAICKALDRNGSGFDSGIAACINDLVRNRVSLNLKAINMSLGGPGASTTLQNAVTNAAANGVVLVAAAGNSGTTGTEYPAGFSAVISVAATSRADGHAAFSNSNADVELSAPGVDVLGASHTSGYVIASGTSAAAPFVAAAAGLLGWREGLSAAAIRDRLVATADDLGPPGHDHDFGHGRLNLCRALQGCGGDPGASTTTAPTTSSTTTSSTTSSSTSSSTTSSSSTTTSSTTTSSTTTSSTTTSSTTTSSTTSSTTSTSTTSTSTTTTRPPSTTTTSRPWWVLR